MTERKKDREISRRKFLGNGAAGLAVMGLSPLAVESLWSNPGWRNLGVNPETDLLIEEEVLREAVKLLIAKGADFGDVYTERASFNSFTSDDRKINTRTTVEKGIGFRAVKNGKTFYAYTGSFDPDEIFKTARFVADSASGGASGEEVGTVKMLLNMTRQPMRISFPFNPDPGNVAVQDKIRMLQGLTDRAWSADPQVVQVSQTFREIIRHVTLAASSGKLIDHTLGLTEFMAGTYMKDDQGNLQRGGDGRTVYAGTDFFKGKNSFESIVDRSVRRAKNFLKAVDSPRGNFPVVLEAGGCGVIFHEACGHGMEADLVAKGSNFKDQIGKQTAAEGVTLIDDGTLPQMPGSFNYDDEGTPSERTVLIENGIQKNYMCDLIWADKLGMRSTGSGRRQSFRYPPIPRMRNTFVDNGSMTPEEILENTKRGLYVAQAGGGQVDVITGNFMMGVTEGYLIENGRKTRPVKGATLSGMGIQNLKTIDMIGNNLYVLPAAGRCGKMQSAPTGEGNPTLRVRGIVVGGKGEAWSDTEGGAR